MYELLRSFWLPLALIVATFARIPFGMDWVGAFTLLLLGAGVGVGIQAMHAHLNDPRDRRGPAVPARRLVDLDPRRVRDPGDRDRRRDPGRAARGALAGRFGYLALRMTRVLVNFFYAQPVGHAVEALHYAHGHHAPTRPAGSASRSTPRRRRARRPVPVRRARLRDRSPVSSKRATSR